MRTSINKYGYDGHSGAMIKDGALKLAKALIFDRGAKLIDAFNLHADVKPIADKLGLSEEFKSALSEGDATGYVNKYEYDAVDLLFDGIDKTFDRILPDWLRLG